MPFPTPARSFSPISGGDGGVDELGMEIGEALEVGTDAGVLGVGLQLGHRGTKGTIGVDEFVGGEGDVHDLVIPHSLVTFHLLGVGRT